MFKSNRVIGSLMMIGLFCFSVSTSFAQDPLTKNTLKLSAANKGGLAKIADIAWLAGTWRGSAFGGEFEEVWSVPDEGVMMGMFRAYKGAKPSFYEFILILEREGSLVLRLKHFHSNFVGWEEKHKTVDFQFIKKEGKRYYFDGLTFEVMDRDNVNVYLVVSSGGGPVQEVTFKYKRAK